MNSYAKIREIMPDGSFLIDGFSTDITSQKENEFLLKFQVALNNTAADISPEYLMRMTLDESEKFTKSHIGFFHLVNTDKKAINTKVWSSETLRLFQITDIHRHHPAFDTGIWADAVREQQPIILN